MAGAARAQGISVDQAVALALQRQEAGALGEARRIYERVLSFVPSHPTALTMLASIAYRQGEDILAEAYLERAIEIYRAASDAPACEPALVATLVNLLLARDRIEEAEMRIGGLELPVNPLRMNPDCFAERQQIARASGLPPILIVTVPKSASESIWNRLAEGLGLAQCHVSLGLFPNCCLVPSRVRALAEGGIVAKEHILPTAHNLSVLRASDIGRIVVHLRDPRQATLSWAHFVRSDISRRPLAPIWRKIVPPATVLSQDLSATLDWCLDHYLPLLIDFARRWIALAEDPSARLLVRCLSFEQFRTAPDRYLADVLDHYGIERSRFAADAGAPVVHWRKGAVDEWRSAFDRGQRRRAWQAIPADLAERFAWPS